MICGQVFLTLWGTAPNQGTVSFEDKSHSGTVQIEFVMQTNYATTTRLRACRFVLGAHVVFARAAG